MTTPPKFDLTDMPTFIVPDPTHLSLYDPIRRVYHVFTVKGTAEVRTAGVRFITFSHPSGDAEKSRLQ